MSYLSGIDSIGSLEGLPKCLSKQIAESSSTLNNLLSRGDLNGLGYTSEIVPFSKVVQMYNSGITRDEIRAE